MSDAATTHQLVVFSLGDEKCATPITRVQEIIDYAEPNLDGVFAGANLASA